MRVKRTVERVDRKPSLYRNVVVVGIVLLIFIVFGLFLREYRRSEVVNSKYRYNMVLSAKDDHGDVSFISFDPEERQVFVVNFPGDLEIKSRSVGVYRIADLHKLGNYEGDDKQFVKRKMQGFMRVPIVGYLGVPSYVDGAKASLEKGLKRSVLSSKDASFSRLDSALLLYRLKSYEWRESNEDELVRVGVISKKEGKWQYSQERLKQFLGVRVFDWVVGGRNITVSIVNASSENGLGSDIAEFLNNLGFDVVNVRSESGASKKDRTELLYDESDPEKGEEVVKLMDMLFGWTNHSSQNTEAYRSSFVIILGQDAVTLF